MIGTVLLCFTLISGTIHASLQEKLTALNDRDMIRVIVHMRDQAYLSAVPVVFSKEKKIEFLRAYAQNNQADLLKDLTRFSDRIQDVKTFWIFNGLVLNATKEVICWIASRDDVDYIIDDRSVMLSKDAIDGQDMAILRVPEWNIQQIKADSCWHIGYDGSGTVIGNMSTGVDTSHPALQGKWVIGGWFDAVNGQPSPYDDQGHGIRMTGIMCGGDGNGPFFDDIGVAPGCRYICAKVFDAGGGAQLSWLHSGLQWFATQSASVVNNPWGMSDITSLEFWDDCLNLRNLGITPVFSVGSSGPGPETACTPGNYPLVIGVGATDASDNIGSFSSRGPAPNQNPWTDTIYWSRPDWNLIKPDIAAPGVTVRSAAPGGGYSTGSGTSTAASHVTGALAILLQKDSLATHEELYQTLLDYAEHPPQGAPYPNNNYGWGRLNVFAALNALAVKEQEKYYRTDLELSIHPNPFTEKIDIRCMIADAGLRIIDNRVQIKIYDVSGRVVRQWDYPTMRQSDQIMWTGTDQTGRKVAAGIYFVELKAEDFFKTEKLVLLH